MLGEIAAAASTTDTAPEAQLTEDPQRVEERDEQENTSNLSRPQRLRQAPKRLTYDSPGEPTYVWQIKVDPYIGIQQYGIPTTPAPYIPEFRVDHYCTLRGALNHIPPPLPPMSWNANMMMMPYMPYTVVPQLPRWGAPYQSFQCR